MFDTIRQAESQDANEKLHYRKVGIYQEQGQLHDRWQDTLILEKLL